MYSPWSKTLEELLTNRTQEQLAAELGVSANAVGEWKRGKQQPRVKNLLKIARFKGCTYEELLLEMARRVLRDLGGESRDADSKEIRVSGVFRDLDVDQLDLEQRMMMRGWSETLEGDIRSLKTRIHTFVDMYDHLRKVNRERGPNLR